MIETSGIKPFKPRAWVPAIAESTRSQNIELPGIADVEFARERLPPRRFE